MIALRNNSHDENIRVCMEISGIKKYSQILDRNTPLYFHSVLLVLWLFTLLQRGHFSKLCIPSFTTSLRRSKPRNGSVGLKVANVYYYDLCLEYEFCKFSSFLERAVLDREGVGTIPQWNTDSQLPSLHNILIWKINRSKTTLIVCPTLRLSMKKFKNTDVKL